MMFELMPELPGKVEPQPESSQTVRKFWRQRVEHSLVPRPETNHRSLRRRGASFRKRFLAHAAAGTSSFLSASTTSAPLSHSLSAQLTPIAARSCRLSTVCKSGPVLLALTPSVHLYHREIKRRNATGSGRSLGAVLSELLCRHGMSVQRIVTENFRRSFGHRDKYPRNVVLLVFPGAEPQKFVEAIGDRFRRKSPTSHTCRDRMFR